MSKVLGQLICLDPACGFPSETLLTERQAIKLPDGSEIVTEWSECFKQSLALRDVIARRGNICTLRCGHERSVWLKLSAQEYLEGAV
jgi:hypothetical protein